MAYMSQENKKSKAPAIKAILKKYGLKGSIAVRHHSTLVVNIASGKIDFIKNFNEKCQLEQGQWQSGRFNPVEDGHIQVNVYHVDSHFSGEAKDCLNELLDVMNLGNFDKSDIQTDYFCVGFYCDINIGQWDKPYTVIA